MSIFLQDARFALRQLWKHPGFTLTAILSLALGIAATVSVFSVVYSVLLKPLPYRDSDQIAIFHVHPKTGSGYAPHVSPDVIRSIRQLHAFERVIEMDEAYLSETTGDLPDDVDVVYLSGDAFPFFGVPAMLGRTFLPSDAPPGQEPQPVIVLSYQYWQRRFASNPSVIGQSLRLEGQSYTILGVMPRRFTWWDADVYMPLRPSTTASSLHIPIMRLRKGVSRHEAEAESQSVFRQMAHDEPGMWPEDTHLDVRGILDQVRHPLGGVLYLLFAGVALLLIIGCGNVSILLLTRGTARRHEFAVRAAVGASAGRIVRQLLTESLLLGCTGAVLGVIATYRSTPWVVGLLPWQLFPRGLEIPIHVPILCFSALLAVLTSLLFGLAPAMLLAKPEIREVMQTTTQKAAGNVAGRRLHSILIGGQIALALMLLAAAATAIQNFRALLGTDLGYDPHHVTDFSIPLRHGSFTNWTERANYFTALQQKVAQIPGVDAAALALIAPPASSWDFPVEILGQQTASSQLANVNLTGPEFFPLLRIPLLEGRLWTTAETQQGATLVIVNRAFVHRYFPGQDAIGHSVRLPGLLNNAGDKAPPVNNGWLQIIGVVGDALNNGIDNPVKPEIYVPYPTLHVSTISVQILVRSSNNAAQLEQSVRRQIAAVNPGQQVSYPIISLETRLAHQTEWARERLAAVLSGIFSSLALILSTVGLYSVVSYNVSQRTHEFGIRMALGAQRRHIVQNVLATTSVSIGAGLGVGLLLSFTFHGILSRYTGTGAGNPLMILAICLLLLVVALMACILPALRASFIQPMKALRSE